MRVLAVAAKECRDVMRERTILAAFAVQLMVAAFSTVLVVGLAALVDPASLDVPATSAVAYAGDGHLDRHLQAAGLRVVHAADEGEARALQAAGRAGAAVVEARTQDGANVTIVVAEGSLDAVVLLPRVREVLEQYQQDLRQRNAPRLEAPVLDVPGAPATAVATFTATTLVPILVLTPAFLAGAIVGDSWTREAQTRTLLLLRTTPLRAWEVVAGKALVPIVLAPAQAAAWLGILALGGATIANWPLVLLVCSLAAALLGGLGITVASLTGRTVASQGAYALVVLAMSLASLFLPRDPLNLVALLAADAVTADVLATVGILAAAALAAGGLGAVAAGRALRKDPAP